MLEKMNRIGTKSTGSSVVTTTTITDTEVVDSSSSSSSGDGNGVVVCCNSNNNDRHNNNNNDGMSGGDTGGSGSVHTSNQISTNGSDVDIETVTANTYYLSTGDIECTDDHLKSYSNIPLYHQVSSHSSMKSSTSNTAGLHYRDSPE